MSCYSQYVDTDCAVLGRCLAGVDGGAGALHGLCQPSQYVKCSGLKACLIITVYVAGMMEPSSSLNVQFVNETDDIVAATNGWEAGRDSADSDDGADAAAAAAAPTGYCARAASSARDQPLTKARPPPGKKTMGRVKIKMEYIKNKVRRYTTFSKRKTGIMKKVNEHMLSYI